MVLVVVYEIGGAMKNRKNVLVAYDGSQRADAALDDLNCAGLPEDMQLTVLSVVEHRLPPSSSAELFEGINILQNEAPQRSVLPFSPQRRGN